MSKTKGLPKTLNASADLAVWTSSVERFLEHLLFRYKWFLITWLDLHTQKLLGKMKILKKVLIHLFESGKTTIEQNLISSFNHFLGLAIPNTWVAGKRERFAYWERLQEKLGSERYVNTNESGEKSDRSINGSRYSRMGQVKFFKGCLPQILLGQFSNTLTQMMLLLIFIIN